jgi:stage II sporulation protein M
MWTTFWGALRGESRSLRTWYVTQVRDAIRRLGIPSLIILGIAMGGFWISFRWTMQNVPRLLSTATSSDLAELVEDARASAGLAEPNPSFSASDILAHNLRATALVVLGGLVSFSVLGVSAYLLNIGVIGGVLAVFGIMGYSPGLVFAAGILPHGAFEIPALMLTSAAVLKVGAVLVTPQTGKSMGHVVLEQLADSAKVLVGVVVPLLLISAVVEAYVTPSILRTTLR